MKWFKHDSSAHHDAKIMKLKHKYGMEGYGLYWLMLELIAGEVSAKNITFELEHDSEVISREWGIDQMLCQEMMAFMCNLGLFEGQDGRITCLKMAFRLDDTNAKNPQIKEIQTLISTRGSQGKLELVGDTPSKSEEVKESPPRLDKTRLDKNKKTTPRKRGYPDNFTVDAKMIEWVSNKYPLLEWVAATENWEDYVIRDGRKFADWRRAWQSGMKKAEQWRVESDSDSDGVSYL